MKVIELYKHLYEERIKNFRDKIVNVYPNPNVTQIQQLMTVMLL